MKLIFNPYYDSKVYVKTQKCALGEKVVGPQGLLNELELRAGLTGRYIDNFQRAIFYARGMKKAIEKNSSLFFAKSFEKDKLGTAVNVMAWRDALIKAGWNKTITGSSRLDDLASVEDYFEEKGEADRWRIVLDYAKSTPLLQDTDCIEVTCGKDLLEPLYKQLFDHMASQGCAVKYIPSQIKSNLSDKTSAYLFKNNLEMAEWLAQQSLGENDVVVCDDTSLLHLDLAMENKPQVGAESQAVGAIMQIFTLGLGLFNKPLDINNLLAYLQLPAIPLSAIYVKRQHDEKDDNGDYYISLRHALFEQLIKDNGISEDWDKLIDEAVYDHDGNDITKSNERTTALLFINQWKRAKGTGDNCVIDKIEVVKYLEAMRKWTKSHLYDESKAPQFNAVADNCETMLMILEDEDDTINTHDLMLWASQISRPIELTTLSARQGSVNVTKAVTDIYSTPDSLYWVCFTPEYHFHFDLGFLTPKEISILEGNGIEVAKRETLLKNKREIMLGILSNVQKHIYLLECNIMGGVLPVEDPAATELRLKGHLSMQPKSPDDKDLEQKPTETDSTKQAEYQLKPSVFKLLDTPKDDGGLKRDEESYSSLEELIQQPFDYVMEYILHLREYGKAAMDDMDTVRGHVAHAYVEKLTEAGQHDVATMSQIHRVQYDDMINHLAETNGSILLLEENDLEFKRFKSLLQKSVDVLLHIIEQNNLSIVGAEKEYEVVVPVIGKMTAKIDFVLKDSDDNIVIIDFKWNKSTTYKKKLEQNDALQLAVYRAVVEQHLKDSGDNHKVNFMGYFVLPRHTLYTTYETLKHREGIEVVVPENTNDLMQLATNSYTYRMRQLKDGLIEEGEGMALANLQYDSDTIEKQLYPLKRDYENSTLKANSYGNKNIVLKGGLV